MKFATSAFALIALTTGLTAAFYWYKASEITPDPGWTRENPEPVIDELRQMAWNTAILDAARKSATLNKIAAIWTAVAVALGAFTNFAALLFPT